MQKTVFSLCVFAVLALSTPADAQTANHRTFFTFSAPVSLPGVTLPAGTYQFRIIDDTTTRIVTNVLDAAGTQSYAMLLSIPAERTAAANDPTIQFRESRDGGPAAIQAWWHPGSTTGYEFVYPPTQRTAMLTLAAAETNGVNN